MEESWELVAVPTEIQLSGNKMNNDGTGQEIEEKIVPKVTFTEIINV